jgi:PIN domain nuclease of toxin-antitoxin system
MAHQSAMILDTCAFLWLASGGKRLRPAVLKQINESPSLYVSAISAFEIALKSARGKLDLPLPAREWFEKLAEHHGISILPMDVDVCVAAAELPSIHNDPVDRFIIATAKLRSVPVVTSDEVFEKYGVTVVF